MFQINLVSGGGFPAAEGTSLTDAAIEAGITLPYSCKTGRCATCRVKVVSGKTAVMRQEFDLTDAERDDGWILGCCRAAVSDLEIDVEDLTRLDLPKAKTLPCRVESIEDVAPDVRKFVLRLPPFANFSYRPGQYVKIIGPGGHRRSYSLANVDAQKGHLTVHVRKVPGGTLSAYWFGAVKKNDLLRVNGPLGTFVLRDVAGRDLVFLATGTGIAPIVAMLEQVVTLPSDVAPKSVRVIWGGRVPADLYLDPKTICPGSFYTPTLSRGPSEWAGARGYVQDVLIASDVELCEARVYACGSESMIRAAKRKLLDAGLPPKAFHSDAFLQSAPSELK